MRENASPQRWRYQCALPGLVWPVIPAGGDATALSLLLQLEGSQWLPPDRLLERQTRQLQGLLQHAHATVPHYRERWGSAYDPSLAPTPARFAALPLLSRRELQTRFEALVSSNIPAAHGAIGESRSSGSTGTPVRVLKTNLNILLWKALTLRDHLWHRRDLGGKLASIRHGAAERELTGWGPATNGLVETGPCVLLGIRTDADTQLGWLQRQHPDYLMTYPSLAAELARASIERGIRLPRLREIRTFGELLTPEVRELCRQAWAAPVTDVYSADEVGYIALQCPQHAHYHVQSEHLLVEILDEQGEPCSPGEVGRVVVTTLHNFAMPLVRYELGDYAEAGGLCPCGRGLPTLKRIVGRVRNMLVTGAGRRYWPSFGTRQFSGLAPVLQHQFVQKELDLIEARLVTAGTLSAEQENGLRRLILSRLPAGFRVKFVYCNTIQRSAGGKFEDFMSEVAANPPT